MISLEAQVQQLDAVGIRLKPQFGLENLLRDWEVRDFEEQPYELLLGAMGRPASEESSDYLSDDIWYFDTAFVDGTGAYVRLAERLRTLSRGALSLESIRDHVDLENGRGWFSFELDGLAYRWDLEVDDVWVDSSVVSRLAELLEKRHPEKVFTYVDLGGQDCLIGFASRAHLETLSKVTGLAFRSLLEDAI